MLSMPPAAITSNEPPASMSCANMIACMPEPHILLTVVEPADFGRPAPSAAWRAGAWPWPAGNTQPIIVVGLEPRAAHRRAERLGAELRRCHGGKIAEQPAHGGARGADDDDRIGLCHVIAPGLTGGHTQGAVETDDLAVQHRVLANMLRKRGEFSRAAETWWEGHVAAQRLLHLRFHTGHHRRFEYARRDRDDTDAVRRQLAGRRQRQARDAAL